MIDESADGLIRLNSELRANASSMMSLWEECGRMCLTHRIQSLVNSRTGTSQAIDSYSPDTKLLNSRAAAANEVMAAGLMSSVMPSDGKWFAFKAAPSQRGNDALEEWLSACTEIALLELFVSGFYSRAHESMESRSCFGTNALFAEAGKKNALRFRAWDNGSYVVSENEDGDIDMVFREVERTARQASAEFETIPAAVLAHISQNKTEEKTRYIHAIFPRSKRGDGPKGMAFASVYIHAASKTICKESGFDEMPAFVSRYRKWSDSSAYGVSPAMIALAEIRGVNYLEMLMATLAEVTVNPRMILPQGFQGVPDLRAGGITFGGVDRNSFPQEWMTGGRFDIGLNLLERKERMIDEAFHRPLFDQFAQLDRQITATEVRAREAEKLARFSPAFTALTTDFVNPLLERAFMLLYRAGKLPPPPRDAFVADALGRPMLLFPSVIQTNRMAQSMALARQSEYARLFELLAPLEQMGRPVFDHLDEEEMSRAMFRDASLPLKDEETVQALRQARQQAAQAAQEREMAIEAAKSAPVMDMAKQAMGGAA